MQAHPFISQSSVVNGLRAARAEAREGMNRRRLLVVIALLGTFLRVAPALRDLDTVDRIFVPDDTYYTLAISRSLANGHGPTVDGMTRTSGFQPLLAFATVPVFFVTDDPDLPLRYVILLGALADVLTILLLARLARRVAGDDAALIAASLWAVSPLAIANALGGLETGLALCVQLALVEAWCVARERGTPRSYLLAGALAGLALLARVDSAFLVAGLGTLELWNGDRRRLGVAIGAAADRRRAVVGLLDRRLWIARPGKWRCRARHRRDAPGAVPEVTHGRGLGGRNRARRADSRLRRTSRVVVPPCCCGVGRVARGRGARRGGGQPLVAPARCNARRSPYWRCTRWRSSRSIRSLSRLCGSSDAISCRPSA
jgi:hypothetical protein